VAVGALVSAEEVFVDCRVESERAVFFEKCSFLPAILSCYVLFLMALVLKRILVDPHEDS
jgi:hypothetical protein